MTPKVIPNIHVHTHACTPSYMTTHSHTHEEKTLFHILGFKESIQKKLESSSERLIFKQMSIFYD